MVFLNKHILLVLVVLNVFTFELFSQTNPNGFNKFYYDNGALSSEGNMKDGKPDGYWKNYYKNGKTTPEMFVMMKLAILTNRKLEEVIAMINIEREKNEKKKNFWIEIYKKITG